MLRTVMPRPRRRPASPREALLAALQRHRPASIDVLAKELRRTPEAVRQALGRLERAGLVCRSPATDEAPRGRGRPPEHFTLSPAGEESLPKSYAEMAVALVDAVSSALGPEALEQVLGHVTDVRAAALAPRMAGLGLAERVQELRSIYRDGDPFIDVERIEGGWRITERNCPFLRLATTRPLVCSTTVGVLARLLGRRVVRERRFQSGDGCCVFFVDEAKASDVRVRGFVPEPDAPSATSG